MLEPAEKGPGLAGPPDDRFAAALAELTTAVRQSCAEASHWPEKLGAGVYSGTGYLAARPEAARELFGIPHENSFGMRYRKVVVWASQMVGEAIPPTPKGGPESAAAALAGALLLIAQEVRLGRPDRLKAMCPDVHLLILLPYLDFSEAQRWAEAVHLSRGG